VQVPDVQVRPAADGDLPVTVLRDLFVDPAAHVRGLGRAILAELRSAADRKQTFPSLHAMPLYTSFGLDAWWPLLYLEGDPGQLPVRPGWQADPVAPSQAAQHERDWTGLDRTTGCLPAPHPAVRGLLTAGWRVDDFDLFMASEPELLDPPRAVPSPGQACAGHRAQNEQPRGPQP
jgi:hypothetical protein